ncbi:MAG: DUF4468 domain-containing protein [Labilibaculum antarcticum]
MKKILIAFMLLCSVSAFAKEYTEVVEVPGKNADQLYSTAREWFAETFKSADDVLQMDDPVAGKLIGKGLVKVPIVSGKYSVATNMRFTIKVFVKDGRYKCDITNILIGGGEGATIDEYESACGYEGVKIALIKAGMPNAKDKMINKILANNKVNFPRFPKEIEKIIESLKVKMKSVEDDW